MPSETELLTQLLKKVDSLDEGVKQLLQGGVVTVEGPVSIHWTLSKTDLIELIYALHSGGAFNKGTASIAQITRFFEQVLQIQLGNTSMTFQEILRRKDSTAFLDRLKIKLDDHITNIDEKKFR
jgi:hypothetical protein